MAITMAAELRPLEAVTSRLRSLLASTKGEHDSDAISQPLPVDGLLPDLDALHDDIPNQYDTAYKYAVVESAARDLFYGFIANSNIGDPVFAHVWSLLDVLMHAGDRDLCAPDLVCLLIEELMDGLTTTDCRTVMDYLESRREVLARKDFHKKNLVLLRACNELLRRLSRAEDAIFCGRVFFFLFMAFPLGDRSSVNLRGEFHTENTTKFDVADSQSHEAGEKMDVDTTPAKIEPETSKPPTPAPGGRAGNKAGASRPPAKKESKELPVMSNSELYPIFWRLQQDFSDPARLFTPAELQRFKTSVDSTVAKFKRTPVVQTSAAEDNRRGTKRKLGKDTNGSINQTDTTESSPNNYNPKYLTSRELFDLELSDLAFQRHVLVQTLILIDFLLSLTEKAKKKSEMLSASNKALTFKDFMLSEEDTAWAIETRSTINSYLCGSQEGKLFQRMVDTVLARDKNWVRWKLDGCPSIVRESVSVEAELEARETAKKVAAPRRVPTQPKNAMKLSFLDESSATGLEALKDPKRYDITSIDALNEGIQNDVLDLEMAQGDAEKESIEELMSNKRWRLLRQARSSRLSILDKVEPGKDLDALFRPPPPPEHEAPDVAVEAVETVDDAPSAEQGINGGPDVVITDEQDADQTNEAVDATMNAEHVDEPAAVA